MPVSASLKGCCGGGGGTPKVATDPVRTEKAVVKSVTDPLENCILHVLKDQILGL